MNTTTSGSKEAITCTLCGAERNHDGTLAGVELKGEIENAQYVCLECIRRLFAELQNFPLVTGDFPVVAVPVRGDYVVAVPKSETAGVSDVYGYVESTGTQDGELYISFQQTAGKSSHTQVLKSSQYIIKVIAHRLRI